MAEAAAPPQDPLTEPGPWNAVAEGYDQELFNQTPTLTERALSVLDVAPTSTVLDLGTGPGTFAVRAASKYEKVVAVDFAEQMIARLTAHLDAAGIRNVETRVMDGHALSFEDASFDAVASLFGWFLFSDRARALGGIRRVLRPGGRVLVTSWATPDRNTAFGASLEALRHALPDLPRPARPFPTQVPETCAEEVRNAGFTDVQTDIVTTKVEYESAAAYWNMMERAGAPMVVLRKRLGDEKFAATCAKACEFLESKLGSGKVTLTLEAIYTSGTRG